MAKSIITVGIEIPNYDVKQASLKSNLSLFDYDIAIFDPNIHDFYGSYENYKGKPSLNDSRSFELKEHLEHWRREILDAIKAGKTVFILLNKLEEVYVATGEKSYSGTGRNRQTTRHVDIFNNYKLVPGKLKAVNSKGKSMRLHGNNHFLAVYWKEMSPLSEYKVLISGDGLQPLVKPRTGDQIVGAYLRFEGISGTLVLLPYIDFDREAFEEYRPSEDQIYWTDEADEAGEKFISSLIEIDRAFHEDTEISIAPAWIEQEIYTLPKEQKIHDDLLKLETKLETIQKEKEIKQTALSDEISFKRLLYEKGKPLETVVRNTLKTLGFDVSKFDNGESEFDVIFECSEGRLLGEVEGKDNKAINIEKLRQLEMNIHEDFDRDEVTQIAKGVLIGNAQRLIPPEERGDFFTTKCVTAATRSHTALIRSIDLFNIAKYLSEKNDRAFSAKCRKEIFDSSGIVTFPPIPKKNPKKKDKISSAKNK